MPRTIFTKEQVDELLENKNVSKCGRTQISYTDDFKVKAVHQYLNQGTSSNMIFKQAGFNLSLIGKKRSTYVLRDWVWRFKTQGIEGLYLENRGAAKGDSKGRPKKISTANLTAEEKIKRLELEVQYLKKENDFLVRLRAKKAE